LAGSKIVKILAKTALALALLALTLTAVEWAARKIRPLKWPMVYEWPRNASTTDDSGFLFYRPGAKRLRVRDARSGKLVIDCAYTIDALGRRVTPAEGREKRDKFILFFGCSNVFGSGLNDDQTIPFHTGQMAPEYMPYNYAYRGGAPFDAMMRLDKMDISEEITEKRGIALYHFVVQGQVRRIVGSPATSGFRARRAYYVEDENGVFRYAGMMKEVQPVRTAMFNFLNSSCLAGRILRCVTWKSRPEDIRLAARAVGAVRDRVEDKLRLDGFYVTVWAGRKSASMACGAFEELGIPALDFSELYDARGPEHFLAEHDSHPSALMARMIARKIVDELGIGAETPE